MKNNPYVGPRPYERIDRHNFYGRKREARELRALIVAEREVLFYAQSGAGKTSLLNAMVIPALEEKGFQVLPVARVGSELPPEIDPQSVSNVFVFSTLLALAGEDVSPKNLLPHTLRSSLEEFYPTAEFEFQPLVLILDQFEEIFTTHRERWQDARGFFMQIREALDALPHLGIVFAMREDHVAGIDPYIPLFPRRLRARFRMERLGPKGALEAVTKPATNAGCPFDPGVAEQLVDNLRRIKAQSTAEPGEDGKVLGPFVEPVQLQVVCNRLWANLPEQEDHAIQWEEVEEYGNIDRALTDFYESALDAAMQETGTNERQLRRWFDQQLITPMGTRGLTIRGPEDTAGLPNAAVDVLEGRHLIRADVRAGTRWYELSHDRLVDPVVQSNQAWEAARETPLRVAARRWQATEDTSLLYRDAALKQALTHVEAHPDEVEPYEVEFLEASQQAERDRVRRRRWYTVGAVVSVVILAVMAALTLWALDQRNKAEYNQREAERQARLAFSGQLAAQSKTVLSESPNRSLMLAIEALNVTLDAGESRLPTAENALRQAISDMGGILLAGHKEKVATAAFSPDGRWLATASDDATVQLWDVSTVVNPEEESPTAGPVVLRGHKAPILSMAFSPDGRRLATGSDDFTARLWDIDNPTAEPVTLHGHEDAVWIVAFSADGRWLATGGLDSTVRLWEVSDALTEGEVRVEPVVLRGHEHAIHAMAFSPDGRWLATGSEDRTVRLWDVRDPTADPIVLNHENPVNIVLFSPDERWLATGGYDRMAWLWDPHNPTTDPMELHVGDDLTAMAFSPDGAWLATGSVDGIARKWNMYDPMAAPPMLRGHDARILAMAFSSDGGWLATGSEDGTTRLWKADTPGGDPVVLRGHEGPVQAVAFSPDGEWLATASADHTAQLWKVDKPTTEPVVLREYEWSLQAVAFSPDGRWLATGGEGATARLWDVSAVLDTEVDSPAAEPVELQGHEHDVNAVAFSPDGHWLATGSLDSTARLWDMSAMPNAGVSYPVAELMIPREVEIAPVHVAFSPDGKWLAAWSMDRTARVWEVDNPTAGPVVLSGHNNLIKAATFSPGGDWLATGSVDGTTRLWKLDDPTAGSMELSGHQDVILAMAFSPDGRWLATGSLDSTARLWDVLAVVNTGDSQTEGQVLSGHKRGVAAVAFSPDGHYLATGGQEGTVRLWEVGSATPDAVAVLQGHELEIYAMTFSPDGRWLATWSQDATARLWEISAALDTEADSQLAESVVLSDHTGGIMAAAFSPDGRYLATGGMDRTVRLWTVELDELMDLACQTAGRNLTYEEWEWYLGGEYQKTCSNLPVDTIFIEGMITDAGELHQDTQAASSIYKEAIEWANEISDGQLHNKICWSGSIHGLAEAVMSACERAVELEPGNEEYHRSRGLAYALMGNYAEAIEDFRFTVERWENRHREMYEPNILELEEWIAELETGRNPFNTEILNMLRGASQ